jgi:hypothetical protein
MLRRGDGQDAVDESVGQAVERACPLNGAERGRPRDIEGELDT